MSMCETFLLSARNNEKGDDNMAGLVSGGLMIIAGILIKQFLPNPSTVCTDTEQDAQCQIKDYGMKRTVTVHH